MRLPLAGNLGNLGHVITWIKGGYLHVVQSFPSEMAQNFWLAAFCLHRLLRVDAGHLAGDRAHEVG